MHGYAPMPSLDRLINTSLRKALIDQYSVDQDGSNVIIIGEDIHYLSDHDACSFLLELLRSNNLCARSGETHRAE